ncbi:MAG: hypothetical protein F6K10_12645 [Moorea sp. SIO2B7]|nr:hypothetical protein [Moorena sp. SIO2B7]
MGGKEDALHLIVEGTASKTGSKFFRSCVRYPAEVLQVRYAVVTKFANEEKTKIPTLAFWTGTTWSEDLEFYPANSPCEIFLSGKTCSYSDRVQSKEMIALSPTGGTQ